jgi:endoglucanase
MEMKSVITLAALLLSTTIGSAEQYIRFNWAGYLPSAEKELIIMSDEDVVGASWSISSNGSVVLEGKVDTSVSTATEWTPKPFNYKVNFSSLSEVGEYEFSLDGREKKEMISISKRPYDDVIFSNLRWLRVLRNGTDDALDRKPAHFGDSACFVYHHPSETASDPWVEDEGGKTADLQGGWYSGPNYSKFTSSIAYTAYYLLKAYEVNPNMFKKEYSKTDLVDILDEAKYGLSYLLKVMPNDDEFYLQIGGFDGENGVRLPSRDKKEGKRIVYSKFSHPQMAFTAAALAAGSAVFEKIGKSEDAKVYKAMAEKIYAKIESEVFAPIWLEKSYELFKDDSRYDNLQIVASEMYNLTGDEKYNDQAKKYSQKTKEAWWAGWNMQNMMAHSLIAKDYKPSLDFLTNDLDNFYETNQKSSNIWGMPMEWGFSGFYASLEIGAAAINYSNITGESKYDGMVQDIIDYSFGKNNWGVTFSATPRLKNSVTNFNLPIYKLQKHLFPEGAIALGAADAEGHDGEAKWILDDVRANYCYPFNTKEGKFFDHEDDYMTMDAWIFGAADNIYLLTLAATKGEK